jgi:hypothetical protein
MPEDGASEICGCAMRREQFFLLNNPENRTHYRKL